MSQIEGTDQNGPESSSVGLVLPKFGMSWLLKVSSDDFASSYEGVVVLYLMF